jgi:5-methyltetrahydrofolate--homocysteine methyltransferase
MKIELDDAEILRYLSAKPGAGIDLAAAKEAVLAAAEPRAVSGVFRIIKTPEGAALENTAVTLTGKAIMKLFENSGRCVLMAVTVGLAVDRLILKTQAFSMAEAVMIDAAASAAAEYVCNAAQREIERSFRLTRRYSCGYGDLPLSCQKDMLAALDASRRIGVTVGSGGIMSPVKSVTAVMGIIEDGEPLFDGCAFCARAGDCEGVRCGERAKGD